MTSVRTMGADGDSPLRRVLALSYFLLLLPAVVGIRHALLEEQVRSRPAYASGLWPVAFIELFAIFVTLDESSHLMAACWCSTLLTPVLQGCRQHHQGGGEGSVELPGLGSSWH